jgi:hypothetical protein
VFDDNSGMPPGVTEEILARQPPEAQAIIRALLAEIAELRARVEDLERQVKGKTPQNSSLPPSTQHPHARPQPPRRKSKRKRGGQQGHEKHQRPLIPTEQCDDVLPLKPTECRRCGAKLSGSDPEPLRHQVWELPEIKPIVTEYQRHRLTCPCCGETTCAELPVGVPQGQSGPRLMAFVALLMAYYRPFAARDMRVVRALGRLSRRQDFAGGIAASNGDLSAARWRFCCCAARKAGMPVCAARAGSCTSIVNGSGCSCAMKRSNRRTMRASGRCAMR